MGEIFRFMQRNGVCFIPKAASVASKQASSRQGSVIQDDVGLGYFQDSAPVILVLDARLSGNFGYYFVHHEHRRLFWLDAYDFTWCVGEVHVNHTPSSIGLEMTSQYWKHVEHFPHLYELTPSDMVMFDNMTSFTLGGKSLVPSCRTCIRTENEPDRYAHFRYERCQYVQCGKAQVCAGNSGPPQTEEARREERKRRGTQNNL